MYDNATPYKYNESFCKYLNIDCNKSYYKSYLLKILMDKLKKNYNNYEVSSELLQILREVNIQFWYNWVSKSRLLSYLEKLKLNNSIPKHILEVKYYEEANKLEAITI